MDTSYPDYVYRRMSTIYNYPSITSTTMQLPLEYQVYFTTTYGADITLNGCILTYALNLGRQVAVISR